MLREQFQRDRFDGRSGFDQIQQIIIGRIGSPKVKFGIVKLDGRTRGYTGIDPSLWIEHLGFVLGQLKYQNRQDDGYQNQKPHMAEQKADEKK